MTQGTSEILWLHSLLTELEFSMTDSTSLFCDNKSTIMLSSDSVDIHFIREKILSGVITPCFVLSSAQTTDMFTKSIYYSHLLSSWGLFISSPQLERECWNWEISYLNIIRKIP